jgi:hypothetical protein
MRRGIRRSTRRRAECGVVATADDGVRMEDPAPGRMRDHPDPLAQLQFIDELFRLTI